MCCYYHLLLHHLLVFSIIKAGLTEGACVETKCFELHVNGGCSLDTAWVCLLTSQPIRIPLATANQNTDAPARAPLYVACVHVYALNKY